MGYSKKRTDRNGKPRYTACYLDVRGSLRSAGTFSNKKDADKAWQKAEAEAGRRPAERSAARTADLPPLRDRGVAASPRHGGEHPGGATPTRSASTSCRGSAR